MKIGVYSQRTLVYELTLIYNVQDTERDRIYELTLCITFKTLRDRERGNEHNTKTLSRCKSVLRDQMSKNNDISKGNVLTWY